jgi:hypothetical protein
METYRVHPLLARNRASRTAGVYDRLSARVAERAGFPGILLTGFGAAAFCLAETYALDEKYKDEWAGTGEVPSGRRAGIVVKRGRIAYNEKDVTYTGRMR